MHRLSYHLVIAILFLSAGRLLAEEADYAPRRVILGKSGEGYSVSVEYQGRFPLKVLSAIEDGMRVRIVCEVIIRRTSDFALSRDEEVYVAEYVRSVQYSLMDGRYLVVNQNTGGVLRVSRRSQLLGMLLKTDILPVVDNKALRAGGKYYAEVRLAIRFGKLYPPFSFLSIMSYESPWIRSGVFIQ